MFYANFFNIKNLGHMSLNYIYFILMSIRNINFNENTYQIQTQYILQIVYILLAINTIHLKHFE